MSSSPLEDKQREAPGVERKKRTKRRSEIFLQSWKFTISDSFISTAIFTDESSSISEDGRFFENWFPEVNEVFEFLMYRWRVLGNSPY